MGASSRHTAFAVGVAFCLALVGTIAGAQPLAFSQLVSTPSSIDEQRARQAALFEQLTDQPDNLDLMFEYATVSIALKDYEAAIATLERMLIYRQDLSRVRLELAVAYFNLGSYEVARLYFEQVLQEPEVPDTVRLRVDRYLAEINARSSRSALTGMTSIGLTYATNATLGPDNGEVELFGALATLNSGIEEDDAGLRVFAAATHLYDLERPNADFWKTDFSIYSLRYFGSSLGNVGFVRLRTGPKLALTEAQFGPRLRPYVEGQFLRSDDRALFGGGGAGVEYENPLSQLLTVFGDFGGRYRDYVRGEFDDEDGFNLYAATGAAYVPARDLVLRATALVEYDGTRADFNSNTEVGLRLGADYRYDPGISWVDRRWEVSTYGELRGRFFHAPEALIDDDTKRKDWDLRGGVSHSFAIQDGFGLRLDVDALLRNSNIVNFDLDNVSTTLSVEYRF